MELLFKKHFWTVHLAFIACAAFFVARTINAFVESALLPAPSVRPAAISIAIREEPIAALNLEKLAKLAGLPLPPPPVDSSTEVVDENAAPVKSSLRVKLLGTLLAGLPEWSIASIQDLGTAKTQTYMVGDEIQGAEILEIDRSRVIIRNGGKREYIAGDGDVAPAAVATNIPVATPVSNGNGIKAIGENEYEVQRSEIDNTLSDLNKVAMQARIVPAFKDGQAQGFKVFSIRPDSIYSRIGVQNGDVIRRINGFEMNSPEKALEVYSKLKDSSRIDIELERNGTPVKKTYNVR